MLRKFNCHLDPVTAILVTLIVFSTNSKTFAKNVKKESLVQLKSKCNNGDIGSCSKLGERARDEGESQMAKYAYDKACEAKVSSNCTYRGTLAREEGNFEEAKEYYNKACNLRDGECIYLELFLKDLSQEKMIPTLREECIATKAEPCIVLARLLKSLGNKIGGSTILRLACDNKNYRACTELGFNYKLEYKNKEADELWKLSCESGYMDGCFNLGFGNDEKTLGLFRAACEKGFLDGCTRLGNMLLTKSKVSEARGILLKACISKEMDACTSLALLEHDQKNASAEMGAWKKACDLGDTISCSKK